MRCGGSSISAIWKDHGRGMRGIARRHLFESVLRLPMNGGICVDLVLAFLARGRVEVGAEVRRLNQRHLDPEVLHLRRQCLAETFQCELGGAVEPPPVGKFIRPPKLEVIRMWPAPCARQRAAAVICLAPARCSDRVSVR